MCHFLWDVYVSACKYLPCVHGCLNTCRQMWMCVWMCVRKRDRECQHTVRGSITDANKGSSYESHDDLWSSLLVNILPFCNPPAPPSSLFPPFPFFSSLAPYVPIPPPLMCLSFSIPYLHFSLMLDQHCLSIWCSTGVNKRKWLRWMKYQCCVSEME